MTKQIRTKNTPFIKYFTLQMYRKKTYLRNLKQNFSKLIIQADGIKRQIKLSGI